jgi:hypothetical protein
MHDPSPLMSQDDQQKENSKRRRGNGKEIDRDQTLPMIF